jgi:hypothetical protein
MMDADSVPALEILSCPNKKPEPAELLRRLEVVERRLDVCGLRAPHGRTLQALRLFHKRKNPPGPRGMPDREVELRSVARSKASGLDIWLYFYVMRR